MDRHHRAAPLVTFTVVFLAIYVPIETWYSLPALWDPFYLVDFIGMVLLAWGAARSRRDARPPSLAILASGYAWEGANFWRALFGRLEEIASGGELRAGLSCASLPAGRLSHWRDSRGRSHSRSGAAKRRRRHRPDDRD